MGRSNRKIWEGKSCVLCGGNRKAESCEHAPPTIIFNGSQRPKGLEVPACNRCNTGASQLDQIVSFLALSQSPEAVSRARMISAHDLKVVRGVANNAPRLHADEKRVLLPSADSVHFQTAYEVTLTPEVQVSVAKWCAKQALAIWYAKTGGIVSHRAVINVDLLTNASRPSAYLEEVIHKMGPLESLGEGKVSRMSEFGYKFCVDGGGKEGLVFAHYHGGFAFISAINDRPSARLSGRGFSYSFATNAHRGIYRLL